jgi:hypothetical protein
VDSVQAAGGDTLVDRGGAQPELPQLVEPENDVLGTRELDQGRLEKPAVFSGFSCRLEHAAMVARKM